MDGELLQAMPHAKQIAANARFARHEVHTRKHRYYMTENTEDNRVILVLNRKHRWQANQAAIERRNVTSLSAALLPG